MAASIGSSARGIRSAQPETGSNTVTLSDLTGRSQRSHPPRTSWLSENRPGPILPQVIEPGCENQQQCRNIRLRANALPMKRGGHGNIMADLFFLTSEEIAEPVNAF